MVKKEKILEDIKKIADEETTHSLFVEKTDYTKYYVMKYFDTWTNAKVEAGIDVKSIKCPNCGVHCKYISNHWNKCGEPELSKYQKSILAGLIMSDATVDKSGAMTVYSSNLDFLQWLSSELSFMAYDPHINDTGDERHKRNIKSGFDVDRDANYKDIYCFSVPIHSFTKSLRDWYRSGSKKFPNININKNIVKIWYCGDGGLNWSGEKYAYPEIRAINEGNRDNFLEKLFDDTIFSPSSTNGSIRIYSNADKFLDWLGDPPSGMEYKWENKNRNKYRELKP